MDSQLKELILSTAEEKANVIQIAQTLGYQPKASVASVVDLDVYQLLPAITQPFTHSRCQYRSMIQALSASVSAATTPQRCRDGIRGVVMG